MERAGQQVGEVGLQQGWQPPCTTPEPYRIYWVWNKDLVTLPWYLASCDHCQDTGIQEKVPILRTEEQTVFQDHFINKPRTTRKTQWSFYFYSKFGFYFTGERSRKQSLQHRLTFTSHTLQQRLLSQFPFQKASTSPAELTASLWPWDAVADLRKWEWCVCVQQINSRTESPDHCLSILAKKTTGILTGFSSFMFLQSCRVLALIHIHLYLGVFCQWHLFVLPTTMLCTEEGMSGVFYMMNQNPPSYFYQVPLSGK